MPSPPHLPRSWRPEPPRIPASVPPWRVFLAAVGPRRLANTNRLRVAVGAGAFLACLALFVWVLAWLRPLRPVGFVFVGAGYETNLAVPINSYGMQGLRGLASVTDSPAATVFRAEGGVRTLRGDGQWDADLGHVHERTVVVYLALHGGTDEAGPYLLPDDADPGSDPHNRLRVAAVLDRLATLPASQNKVLVLEGAQELVNWEFGQLQNDFARGLQGLDARIAAIPNLVVLHASAPDQRSWVSEDYRNTAFCHFLTEGLKGQAPDTDGDGRLSLYDLFVGVRDRVGRWVLANRGESQTPFLLPAGPEGERRARTIDLGARLALPAADPDATPIFELPPGWRDAWDQAGRLAAASPRPAVYAPHLWRRYLATLIRFEQLLVAGDNESALRLRADLTALEGDFQRLARLDLSSAGLTLTMPSLAGAADEPGDEAVAAELWAATPADAPKVWEKHRNALPPGDPLALPLLRSAVGRFLIGRAAADPPGNLLKAADLARLVDAPEPIRQAELHFLSVLTRDLPSVRPDAGLLTQALVVRRQAEEAAAGVELVAPKGPPGPATDPGTYPYSGLVSAWVRPFVRAGDRRRLDGQDRLFASDRPSWEASLAAFQQAAAHYNDAKEVALAIRRALSHRDRLLAGYYWYSRWAAGHVPSPGPAGPGPAPPDADRVTADWEELYRLSRELVRPPADPGDGPGTPDAPPDPSLLERVRLLDQKMRTLYENADGAHRNSEAAWLGLARTSELVPVLRRAGEALAVPMADNVDLRAELLTYYRRASRFYLLKTAGLGEPAEALDPARLAGVAQAAGRRQGRVALAILGKDWFDRPDAVPEGTARDSFENTAYRLANFNADPRWWDSLNRAGAQIGLRWRSMPAALDRLARAGREADDPDSLADADLRSRAMDGFGAGRLTENPADAARRRVIAVALVAMAGRTWREHWASDVEVATAYYRRSGGTFLGDARVLLGIPEEGKDPPSVTAVRDLLDSEGVLLTPERVGASAGRLALTTERSATVKYRLAATKGLPAGHAVVRLAADDGLRLLPGRTASGERLPAVGPGDTATAVVDFALTSPLLDGSEKNRPTTPDAVPRKLALSAYYRGQRLSLTTDIDLYPLPDIRVSEYPPPKLASLSVSADPDIIRKYGTGDGAVSIVLDCSGSMRPPQGQRFGPTTKFTEATDALRQVLRRLPKGTRVSLWTFGKAVGIGRTVADAEETIDQPLKPTTWDPDDPEQLTSVMAGVTPPTLEPWNESPIVRTMIQAKADLAGVKGFRVLLVITDGMDNRFAKDKKYNPDGLAIPEALRRQFEDSGIMVSVVGFKVVPAELAEARKQFAVLERLPVRGRFVEAEDVKPLIEVIDAAIGQRMRYWLERRNNVRIPPSGYQDVSAGSESLSWFLPGLEEGGFRVRVPGDPFISKDVFLSPGDRLLVRLEEAGGRPAFRRGKYVTADRFPLRTPVTRSGWQSAILQNQRQENGLRMLTTLERVPDPAETVLQMVRPRSVWLSVRPPVGIAKKAAVHWYYQPGYPAPAWGVDSPRWPDAGVGTGLTPPVLDLWWNPDRDFTPVQALDRESDFNDNSQLTGQSVVLDEGTDDAETAVIESVTAETHLVEVRPGEFKEEPCLVVRLRHQKPGRPAWVFQRGLPATAAEHRYFAEALASTHLFWPVKPEEAESLRRLLLVGVAGYKRQAEARGFALTRDDLPAPDPDDARPPLPVLLP